MDASAPAQSTVARVYVPPEFMLAEFDGVAIEAMVLGDHGISGPVITTLMNVRKPVTRKI